VDQPLDIAFRRRQNDRSGQHGARALHLITSSFPAIPRSRFRCDRPLHLLVLAGSPEHDLLPQTSMFRFARRRLPQPLSPRQGADAPRTPRQRSSGARTRTCPAAPRALDLTWITETFAIGGSFAPNQTEALARDHRVDAVVDVRGEACDDERLLARYGIELLHLPTIDFEPISPRLLPRGIEFVTAHLKAHHRVLVHCGRGIGRSALLGLCVLVECGHAPLEALELAKGRRAQVSPSPAQYEAWASWLTSWRDARGASWRVPTLDEFKAIAYRPAP
jgi:Dual specificity phosphatase, catalytic domain